MTTWQPLNVNARVRVKLTPYGYDVYKRHMLQFPGVSLVPRVDAGGWFESELWNIAHIFGPKMYNGCEVPFETTVFVKYDGD